MTLLFAVLGASLLGSVHCAAMCGGFTCLYAGPSRARATPAETRRQSVSAHAAYNVGRLVSYLLLGALAGSVGKGVDHIGVVAGMGRLAAIAAGALMVVWGAGTLLAASGVRVPRAGVPRALQTTLTSALVRFRGQTPTIRGAATGLLTTLLPCGWLYVFVATAGGTGRVIDGIAVMAFFWVGTLPVMLSVGFGAQRLFGAFQRRLPLVGAAAALLIGLLSMAGRLTTRPLDHDEHGRAAETGIEVTHDAR